MVVVWWLYLRWSRVAAPRAACVAGRSAPASLPASVVVHGSPVDTRNILGFNYGSEC